MFDDILIGLASGSAGAGITFTLLMFILKGMRISLTGNTAAIAKNTKRISRFENNCVVQRGGLQHKTDAVIHYLLACDDGSKPQARAILEDALRQGGKL